MKSLTSAKQLPLFDTFDFVAVASEVNLSEQQLKWLRHHVQLDLNRIRYEVRSIDSVFNEYKASKPVTKSQRYQRMLTYFTNRKCVKCGVQGDVFLSERQKGEVEEARHLNMYAITKHGLILMTVDHIVPDSCGGRYHVDNFQTMCSDCNNGKSNYMSLEEIAEARTNRNKYKKEWWNEEMFDLVLYIQEQAANEPNKGRRTQWYKLIVNFKQYTGKFEQETPEQVPELIDRIKTKIYALHRSHGVKKCPINVVPAKELVYTWAFWNDRAKRLCAQIVKVLANPIKVKFRSPIVFVSKESQKSAQCASTTPSRQKIATAG